jgi:hypothetical protein
MVYLICTSRQKLAVQQAAFIDLRKVFVTVGETHVSFRLVACFLYTTAENLEQHRLGEGVIKGDFINEYPVILQR